MASEYIWFGSDDKMEMNPGGHGNGGGPAQMGVDLNQLRFNYELYKPPLFPLGDSLTLYRHILRVRQESADGTWVKCPNPNDPVWEWISEYCRKNLKRSWWSFSRFQISATHGVIMLRSEADAMLVKLGLTT